MVEKHVEEPVLAGDIQRVLRSDERESHTQLKQEATDVIDQPALDVLLFGFTAQGQKIEIVGIFEQAMPQIGLRVRKRPREVCLRIAKPLMKPAFDLMDENVSA